MSSSSDSSDCVQLDWTLSFQSASMRQEFFNFMRSQRTSNLTLLISCLTSLLMFLPFNIFILIDKSNYQEDFITPLLSCLMIVFAILLSFSGFLLYFCTLYDDLVFGSRFCDHIPSIQVVFIIGVNIFNVLSAYHLAYQSSVCDEIWIVSDWYCLGDDVDSSFFSLFNVIALTPLVLLIGLRETRVHLIWIFGFCGYFAVVTMALLKDSSTFAFQLTTWSIVIMIIFVDVHLARVEKFLEHRKLQLALEDIERLQAVDRETELRHMIGNVAHDLKTPLSSISTAIEMIGDTLKQIEQMVSQSSCAAANHSDEQKANLHAFLQAFNFIKQSLHAAHNTSNFMFMTINRCIDYTKASKGIKLTPRPETVHWSQALEVPLDCMHQIQEKVEVILQPIPKEICSHIITDKQWLQENVLCLLSNAVKYSNGGVVTVSAMLKSHSEAEKKSVIKGEKPYRSKFIPRKVALSSSNRTKITPIEANESTISSALSPEASECYLCYEVEDSGIGVSEEMMTALFNPFKQAQRLAGGTGLGLYSLAKRMDAIKGFYGVHKRADGKQGSVFWFAIPYRPDLVVTSFMKECILESDQFTQVGFKHEKEHDIVVKARQIVVEEETKVVLQKQASNRMPLQTSPHRALQVKMKKILLVDDSPTIVRMMSMMLTRQGYEVIVAENGMLALEKIQIEWNQQGQEPINTANNASAGFALILMDMQMPVMDGIEATKRLRLLEEQHSLHRSSSLTVIGMSANSDDETKEAALIAGVNEFVSKPISMGLCSQLITKYVK